MSTAAVDAAIDRQLFRRVDDGKRGIPEAIFIENVEAMCTERTPAVVVARLQELYSKYQYMSSSIVAQRAGLKVKLPDIASALETVNHLVERRDKAQGADDLTEYTYQLAENIMAKAAAPPTNSVCLWLGANCMLEYTLEEAVELLRTNEANAKTLLKSLDEDMAFLRDQITTTEVNIARCHNFGVKLRQKEKEEGGEAAPAPVPALPSPAAAPASFAPPARDPGSQSGTTEAGQAYSWKQDREEIEITVPLPAGAQKGDVKVVVLAESLRVEHLGKALLEGRFAGRCSPNGSTWTIGSGRVEISLEKAEAVSWPSLFEAVEV